MRARVEARARVWMRVDLPRAVVTRHEDERVVAHLAALEGGEDAAHLVRIATASMAWCMMQGAGRRLQGAAYRVVELRQRIGEGAAPRAVGAPRRAEQRHVHVGKAHVEKEWPPRLRCSGDHRVGVGGVPGTS